MKKHREFADILDKCLERLLVRGETIEACLKDYPEQADELKALLQTAIAAKEASVIEPRPEFKTRARYQFHSALRQLQAKKGFALFNWRSRWATAIISVLVLIFASTGTVAAASGSMPDEPLYPVKLATEEAWLKLTPSDVGKAEIYARLVDRRVKEIIYMANKGKAGQVEQPIGLLSTHLESIPGLVLVEGQPEAVMATPPPSVEAPPPPAPARGGGKADKGVLVKPDARTKLKALLVQNANRHPAALRAVLKRVPAKAKPVLLRAIHISETGYRKALSAIED